VKPAAVKDVYYAVHIESIDPEPENTSPTTPKTSTITQSPDTTSALQTTSTTSQAGPDHGHRGGDCAGGVSAWGCLGWLGAPRLEEVPEGEGRW